MADLKLTDLRVAKAEPSRMNLRFATIDDILEVAATLPGAETVPWCELHHMMTRGVPYCWIGLEDGETAGCRIAERLVIPLAWLDGEEE